MNLKKIFFIAGCLFMLTTACSNQPNESALEPQENQGLELNKLKANSPVDQNPANKAKQILSKHEEVNSVRAVNHDKQLIVGVKLNHHDRFNKDDIERTLQKEIKEDTSDMKVTLSTDEKIHLEVKKLEQDMEDQQLSKKELKQKLKKIHSLSKEKT